jgi:hypothetical protein|tara:strand:+ start:1008 stop:1568 length:561 start_codon:yes stop_codon:yes gene_type:complete
MDFEQANEQLSGITEQGLSTVSKLAKQQLDLEQRIRDLEHELKQTKAEHLKVASDLLPSAMQEQNISELTLDNGAEIKVRDFVRASIPVANRDKAFEWLNENGHGGIIKNHITAEFSRGQDNLAKNLEAELNAQAMEQGFATKVKKWVEPMTLKSFCREQIEKGNNLPHDLLGVFIGQETKIIKTK